MDPLLAKDRRPRVLLIAFCLFAWLPGFFTIPTTDRDEARFVQATRQMLDTGDFVTIRNGQEARNRKPIGIYWLQAPFAAAARAAGLATENPIWPYRIPSLLGALAAALATFQIGVGLLHRRAALLAAFMLAACVLLSVESGIAKTDAALLGATTVAMAVLARAWLGQRVSRGAAALFWVAMAAGILIKGPITPLVAGLAALALVLSDRRTGWLLALRPASGVALLLLLVLPWFVAIGLATHGAFFQDALGGDLGNKLAGGDDAHGAPPGYHLLLLSATLFPAAPVVLCALPWAWRQRREPAVRFLLAWIIPAWLVFEAVPTKLPHYPLPLFPALCLLGAAWISLKQPVLPPRWLRTAAVFLAGIVVAAIGLGAVAIPILLAHGFVPLGLPALLAAALLGWFALRPWSAGRWSAGLAGGLLLTPVLMWAVLEWEMPRLPDTWLSDRLAAALAQSGPNTGVAVAGYAEPSLMFLAGTGIGFLPNGAAASRFLAAARGRIALVDRQEADRFAAENTALGRSPKEVARVEGFNYSNGHAQSIGLYHDFP